MQLCVPGLLALFPFAQASAQCELFKRTDALAPVPIGTFDLEDYGSALDLDGDRLAIGSRGTFAQGGRPGFVEVLDRDGVNWVPLGRWDSVDLDPNFGGQVAVGGDVLAVSQTDDVLVYEFVSGVWVETARLLSENGLQGNGGGELAVDGDRILVGAINAKPFARVYVFERTVGAWTLADTLISSGGRAGWSVDLEGDRALVGAPFQNVPGGQGAGAAYVFEFDGVDWVEVERLTASDPTIDARFGLAVALAGERAVIGAPFSNRAIFHGGAAYFFERDSGGDWSEAWAHTPSDTSSSALFGVAVDLHGTLAAVGATLQDSFPGAREGLVSVFEEQSGAWGELTTLLPSDASPGDQFGVQVVTDGELVIATAEWEDEEGPNFGAVYGFSVTGAICPTLQSFPRRISLSGRRCSDAALACRRRPRGPHLSDGGKPVGDRPRLPVARDLRAPESRFVLRLLLEAGQSGAVRGHPRHA